MRKAMMLAAAATAIFSAASLMPGPTHAMTFGSPAGVLGAAAAINPIENVACWRYGWHGLGWYPCGGVVVVRRGWGWRGRGWGGRGRGWGGRGWHRSDIQLKHDIVLLGHLDNGLGLYRFSYNGSDKAYVGVMAQEVEQVMPQAVARGSDGYLRVNYDRLGVRFQTWDAWKASGQKLQ